MPSDRAERIRQLLRQALVLESSERIEFLAELSPDDRQDLDAILRSVGSTGAKTREESSWFFSALRSTYGHESDPGVCLDEDDKEADAASVSVGSDRYALRGEIEKGGMGVILRVWDRTIRRHLAMKRVLEKDGGDDRSPISQGRVRRFVEEAQVTGQLDHPGVVPVHELGIDENGRVFFTMALVKGMTLEDAFEKVENNEDGWNQVRALNHLSRACETLAFAHERRVVHRDIKPANIMVGRFGETYVMDWGLSKVLGRPDPHDLRPDFSKTRATTIQTDRDESDRHGDSPVYTMNGDIIGTPAFMPPEQARGEIETIDGRSDVYAMGAVLYHLLAGHPPYLAPGTKATPYTLLRWVQEEPPTPLEERRQGLPGEVIAVCEKAMARDITDRYASMREMADDLRAYLEHRVVKAYRTGPVIELRKWIKRNRALAVSLIVAIMFALLGLGGVLAVTAVKNEDLASKNMALQLAESDLKTKNTALTTALSSVQRLADAHLVRELEEEALRLWPQREANADAFTEWLRTAEDVLSRLDRHRADLEALKRVTIKAVDSDAVSEAEILTSLVADLAELEATGGLSEIIEKRLDTAWSIREATIANYEEEWRSAIEEIARSSVYGGIVLRPEVGLVPLEADPSSELWEFWVWETGDEPERNEDDDSWAMTGDSGIVLVLIPGGQTTIGSSDRRGHPLWDPSSQLEERPAAAVVLEPFFISKYEMTQGQWLRLTGKQPSHYRAERPQGKGTTLAHPVENISWDAARIVLENVLLRLPTEVQWEHATRAGTKTPWSTDDTQLAEHGNVADQALLRSQKGTTVDPNDWNDGHIVHAPVGRFLPNPFGLHDVHGNVWEWCLDLYADQAPRPRFGDGLRGKLVLSTAENDGDRTVRGGSYEQPAKLARSAYRGAISPKSSVLDIGVRPCRPVALER